MAKSTVIFWIVAQEFLRSKPRLNEIGSTIFTMIYRELTGYTMNSVAARELVARALMATQGTANHIFSARDRRSRILLARLTRNSIAVRVS